MSAETVMLITRFMFYSDAFGDDCDRTRRRLRANESLDRAV